MRRDSIIYLIPYAFNENKMGDVVRELGKPRQIFAEKKSIRQSEFYQAQASDFKPELTFVVWTHEYQNETILKYKGANYKIFRTFEKEDKEMELICEGVLNHANA